MLYIPKNNFESTNNMLSVFLLVSQNMNIFLRNFCSPLHCFMLPYLYMNTPLCMCFMLLFLYIHIRPSVNNKFPGSFFGFCREIAHTKIQQSTDRASKHNGRTVFTCVSTGRVNFVFNPLSSIYSTSSLFAPTSLFASSFATHRVRPPPDPVRHNNE